ncbi:hypothetical protein LHJ74_06550 [Streptomyces sp. N2-109]|uniref:PQ-loop repeat-containing protein n=1 Tax=Streptomyces gossypii TaxID=2883101 RepID=A0ABT2JQE1_9ACTN|nr:hypothetical protein [Streptomyces gossypii]MCT2589585.1 hypothetical protein [Streptomyces gossypii]
MPENSFVADLCGLLGGGLLAAMVWPQAWRLWRHRLHHGVSLAYVVLNLLMVGGWVAYGIGKASIAIILPNVLAAVAALALLVGFVRQARPSPRFWPAALAVGTALLAATAAAGGWTALGSVVGLMTVAVILPQVTTLATRRRAGDLDASGVSRASWMLSAAANVLLAGYGLFEPDAVILVTAALSAALSGAVLTLTATAPGADTGLSTGQAARPAEGAEVA